MRASTVIREWLLAVNPLDNRVLLPERSETSVGHGIKGIDCQSTLRHVDPSLGRSHRALAADGRRSRCRVTNNEESADSIRSKSSLATAIILAILAFFISENSWTLARESPPTEIWPGIQGPAIVVLGVAQDGGFPQAGCRRPCCAKAWADPRAARLVACLAIIDPTNGDRWLIECGPDFPRQLRMLDELCPPRQGLGINGILLTHAHIGHYGGLIQLGREVLGTKEIPVHAMPRMESFLRLNGPWRQLVELKQIDIRRLVADEPLRLNPRIEITPILVPHRDEFSETVAFRIEGPNRRVLFVPDIDKWEQWERSIEQEIVRVDIAYIDGTFFSADELPGRDLREIPHPLVHESMVRFAPLPIKERAKIRFIHLNHTNPLLDPNSAAAKELNDAGMCVAIQGEIEPL